MKKLTTRQLAIGLSFISVSTLNSAHDIEADQGNQKQTEFDIVHAQVSLHANSLSFQMQVSGKAGNSVPTAVGTLAGSDVFSYVWPTTLDTSVVGFAENEGILALAVTAHPDFDDTPLFDENADGERTNDGALWHSHWVVLVGDESCGAGALKVKDIPQGETPTLPLTWPGLPLLLDSPGYTPIFSDQTVEVLVPMKTTTPLAGAGFDAVTAGLRINASAHDPLLCVVDVFDVASGDLSLPGTIQ